MTRSSSNSEEESTLLAKINLVSSTALMALIARSLLYPRILAFVPGLLGSEPAQFVILLQLVNLRQIATHNPGLLYSSLLGRVSVAINALCLAIFARNLYQGMVTAPQQLVTALQQAHVPPTISSDTSLGSRLWRLAALIPLFVVSRKAQRVEVQYNVPYADLGVVHPSMLERWKRSPVVIRNMSTLLLRGRMSKWLNLDVHTVAPGTYEGKRPVLVYIHGGAWLTGDKQWASRALINRLASSGIVVCSVNYRMSPEVAFPDHIIDCKRALLFVKKHCEVWGGDASKVFVAGESAGGHLSALLGCTPNYAPFQPPEDPLGDTSVVGALPIYGVYDWMDTHGHLKEAGQEYLGVAIGIRPLVSLVVIQDLINNANKSMWQEYSPTFHLHRLANSQSPNTLQPPPAIPPFFISHGTLDALTSYEDSVKFFAQLQQVRQRWPLPPGVGDAHAPLEGGIHGFGYFPSPRSHALADAFCDFIFYHAQRVEENRV